MLLRCWPQHPESDCRFLVSLTLGHICTRHLLNLFCTLSSVLLSPSPSGGVMVKGGWLDALLHRSKSPNAIAINDTRSCQHIPKMVLFCHEYYEVQQMRQFLRTLSRSSSTLWKMARAQVCFGVMDDASFHHSDRIEQLRLDTGVKLIYLPPYSPDLNPIELKAFI